MKVVDGSAYVCALQSENIYVCVETWLCGTPFPWQRCSRCTLLCDVNTQSRNPVAIGEQKALGLETAGS